MSSPFASQVERGVDFIYLFIEIQHNGARLTPRHTDMRGKNEIKQQVIKRKIKSVNK